MDFLYGRFGNKVQNVCTSSAKANDRNPLIPDAFLNRPYRSSRLESIGNLKWPHPREKSSLGASGLPYGSDNPFRIAVNQITHRLILLWTF